MSQKSLRPTTVLALTQLSITQLPVLKLPILKTRMVFIYCCSAVYATAACIRVGHFKNSVILNAYTVYRVYFLCDNNETMKPQYWDHAYSPTHNFGEVRDEERR